MASKSKEVNSGGIVNRLSNVVRTVAESAKDVYHILVVEPRVPSYVEENGNYYYSWSDAHEGKNRIQNSAILAAIKAKEARKTQKGETHVNQSISSDIVKPDIHTFSKN